MADVKATVTLAAEGFDRRSFTAAEILRMQDAGIVSDDANFELHLPVGTAGKFNAALADIPAGAAIIKFGVVIGLAIADIRAGQWIHLHNCRSQVDERSGTLDNETGAPTDTTYQ